MPHSARWEVVTEGGGGCEGASSQRHLGEYRAHGLRSPAEITDVSVPMGKDTVERPG